MVQSQQGLSKQQACGWVGGRGRLVPLTPLASTDSTSCTCCQAELGTTSAAHTTPNQQPAQCEGASMYWRRHGAGCRESEPSRVQSSSLRGQLPHQGWTPAGRAHRSIHRPSSPSTAPLRGPGGGDPQIHPEILSPKNLCHTLGTTKVPRIRATHPLPFVSASFDKPICIRTSQDRREISAQPSLQHHSVWRQQSARKAPRSALECPW